MRMKEEVKRGKGRGESRGKGEESRERVMIDERGEKQRQKMRY